ncbi:unnamed protein product [Plutella xylostella]|uniref:(diamondback moth) hypothetical protein n=1 Tax=Plutella xylostella TaxID=51655 RepID=A0A8S4DU28_PLUXY|nr:unnamed protein product [Plutella xylostella]
MGSLPDLTERSRPPPRPAASRTISDPHRHRTQLIPVSTICKKEWPWKKQNPARGGPASRRRDSVASSVGAASVRRLINRQPPKVNPLVVRRFTLLCVSSAFCATGFLPFTAFVGAEAGGMALALMHAVAAVVAPLSPLILQKTGVRVVISIGHALVCVLVTAHTVDTPLPVLYILYAVCGLTLSPLSLAMTASATTFAQHAGDEGRRKVALRRALRALRAAQDAGLVAGALLMGAALMAWPDPALPPAATAPPNVTAPRWPPPEPEYFMEDDYEVGANLRRGRLPGHAIRGHLRPQYGRPPGTSGSVGASGLLLYQLGRLRGGLHALPAPDTSSILRDPRTLLGVPMGLFIGLQQGFIYTSYIKRLAGTVPREVAISCYFATIQSLLTYGIELWGRAADWHRAFVMQKRAVRAMARIKSDESARQYFVSLEILTCPSLYILSVALFVRKNLHLYKECRGARRRGQLLDVQHRLARSEQSVYVCGPGIYNKLPTDIKSMQTLQGFKYKLKKWLATQAFYTVGEFIDRRGVIKLLISVEEKCVLLSLELFHCSIVSVYRVDRGSNFIGANRLLQKEYKEILQTINEDLLSKISSEYHTQWKFNAPAYPSAGGLWEAAVKSLKYHLKRVIGEQKLTYEEFITLLHQIEACLNSRPLISLSESPDGEYLSPGHFLVGGSLITRPQTDPEQMNLTTRWRLIQSMNKQFWKKWSSDYLQQLQIRTKWRTSTKNMAVDDVVLIKDDNLPPGKWALGRIVAVHPGQDGHCNVPSMPKH